MPCYPKSYLDSTRKLLRKNLDHYDKNKRIIKSKIYKNYDIKKLTITKNSSYLIKSHLPNENKHLNATNAQKYKSIMGLFVPSSKQIIFNMNSNSVKHKAKQS